MAEMIRSAPFPGSRKAVALTGATGFLGSHLMAELLKVGRRVVVLGRPANGETLNERVSRLLSWFGINGSMNLVETVEVDLSMPLMGIPAERYLDLCRMTDVILHCASDTSFTERRREQVFDANVRCLDNILKFASDTNVSFFHYISTAYAVGLRAGICEEKPVEEANFVNAYEESKALAEKIIAEFCENNFIPFTILRPPIVYGDSSTGRSLKFNALYYPVNSMLHIRDIYLNDIKRGGNKSKESGIFLDRDDVLNIPLRVYLPQEGSLNLIPVDYFVKATLSIIFRPMSGGIYHLTNKIQTRVESVAEYIERFLKIKGIQISYGHVDQNTMPNPAEELFDHFIKPYRPYLSDQRIFVRNNADQATHYLSPPEFNYKIFERCMEYAIRVDWGKDLFIGYEANVHIANAST